MRKGWHVRSGGLFLVGGLIISTILLPSSLALAGVPHLIRYQGQAVDSQGVPLEGPYTLTFRLYDAATVGTKVWEEIQPNVPLQGGHFSVLLGQITSLTTMDWSQPRWLSIQVGTESELAPRQQITSVPMAIRAETSDKLAQPITPTLIIPQGVGSGLDADTVDGKHAADVLNRANHTGTQPASTITGTFPPSMIAPQGSGSGLDADTVDGRHASDFARSSHSHQCGSRDASGLPRESRLRLACEMRGEWCVVAFSDNGSRAWTCDSIAMLFGTYTIICCQ